MLIIKQQEERQIILVTAYVDFELLNKRINKIFYIFF